MNSDRQKLIQRARELNTTDFPVVELQERSREVCFEYLIEAKVDVDRLLRHQDWRVRSSALNIVWWGLGETDGIQQSIQILMHDPDEDIRSEAALALYEAARNTPKEDQVRQAFKTVYDSTETPDFLRDQAQTYLCKLDRRPSSEGQSVS